MIEVMKQALEALIRTDRISGYPNNKETITALRQAIDAHNLASDPNGLRNRALDKMAENARELGLNYDPPPCPSCEYNKARAANWRAEAYRLGGHDYIPRLWVGLTKEEIDRIFWIDGKVGQFWWERTEPDAYKITQMISDKLKEKNT